MTATFDPSDLSLLRDPYATFADMRAAGGVHWCEPLSGWLAVDWDSVNAVVGNPKTFSANRIMAVHDRLREPDQANAADVLRWLSLWMALAKTSLPVPVSPNNKTVVFVMATFAASCLACIMAGEPPNMCLRPEFRLFCPS